MEDLNKLILEKMKTIEKIINKEDKTEETEQEITELRELLEKFIEKEI